MTDHRDDDRSPDQDPAAPVGGPVADAGGTDTTDSSHTVDSAAGTVSTGSADRADTVSRRTVFTAGAVGLTAVLGMGALTVPLPGGLGSAGGDQALARAVEDGLDGHRAVALTLVEDGTPRSAVFGADESTEFEIGSISKGFAGNLLALGIEKDGLTLETTVADVLGDRAARSPIADVTLRELTTHTSGLPPLTPKGLVGALWRNPLRKDPHGFQTVDDVIDGALAITPENRGTMAYSNLAVALLGQLLALAARTDYASLLTERILDPLRLSSTYAPVTPQNLRPSAERGRTAQGHRAAPWTMGGLAPAGGIRSTLADMTTFLQAMMDGSAPGASAADEVLYAKDGETVAMNWMRLQPKGGPEIRWHNGMTGGYASFLGWAPERRRGVVLLSATAKGLDSLAVDLLTGEVDA